MDESKSAYLIAAHLLVLFAYSFPAFCMQKNVIVELLIWWQAARSCRQILEECLILYVFELKIMSWSYPKLGYRLWGSAISKLSRNGISSNWNYCIFYITYSVTRFRYRSKMVFFLFSFFSAKSKDKICPSNWSRCFNKASSYINYVRSPGNSRISVTSSLVTYLQNPRKYQSNHTGFFGI